MRLSTDPTKLKSLYNIDAQRSLLFSAIRLDSHPLVAPIIAEQEGEDPLLLVRQQEQGNVLSAGVREADIRFYAPWVTIDPTPIEGVDAATSLPELVEELSDPTSITLGPEVVYAHYLSLEGVLDVEVDSYPDTPVRVYQLDMDNILDRFASWRRAGIPEAKKLIDGVAHLEGLEHEIEGTGRDTRFTALEELALNRSLAGIFVASPPNFSELTGMAASADSFALWSAEGVFICCRLQETILPRELLNTVITPRPRLLLMLSSEVDGSVWKKTISVPDWH